MIVVARQSRQSGWYRIMQDLDKPGVTVTGLGFRRASISARSLSVRRRSILLNRGERGETGSRHEFSSRTNAA